MEILIIVHERLYDVTLTCYSGSMSWDLFWKEITFDQVGSVVKQARGICGGLLQGMK